jgi:type II secretory pathway predicted ATPase ExeA
MYIQFFGLKCKPFSLVPDQRFLYLSNNHKQAYGLLEYAMYDDSGSILVLTGEIGAGKSILVSNLLQKYSNGYTTGLIASTNREFGQILPWVLQSFGIKCNGSEYFEKFQCLADFLVSENKRHRPALLVVDEAQNLTESSLEELRTLVNLNNVYGQVFKLMLVGQSELIKNLETPNLEQFVQRVSLQFHLTALSKNDCAEYIDYRMKVAGSESDIFDHDAKSVVWYHSRGIPRIINILCDLSLTYAYAEMIKVVNSEIVNCVIKDRKNGGLFISKDSNSKGLMECV